MRRTKPVGTQVIPPFHPTNALLQKRLIDFDTGSPNLEEQHKQWLTEAMNRAKTNSAFHVRIFGYASRLGGEGANMTLSIARMQAVLNFIKSFDPRVMASVEMWQAFGETGPKDRPNDDSPEYRAVEVHIFIGEIPPPPPGPGNKKVDPPQRPPLPGGARWGRWSVASPGGFTVTLGPSIGPLTAGVTTGFNVFGVKNEETGEIRKYVSPVAGPGVSLGLKAKFMSLKNLDQLLATGGAYSGWSYEAVFPRYPVNWEDVERCLVTIMSAGATVLNGAVITFGCPELHHYGPSGLPIKTTEDIWSFNSSGSLQLAVGANATVGVLWRV